MKERVNCSPGHDHDCDIFGTFAYSTSKSPACFVDIFVGCYFPNGSVPWLDGEDDASKGGGLVL